MKAIKLFVTLVILIISHNTLSATDILKRIQYAEVVDSIMFDAITEILKSDSLQHWVKKYYYPNRAAQIKQYKYINIAFNDYINENDISSNEYNTSIQEVTIIYCDVIASKFYTLFKGTEFLICNFISIPGNNPLKFIKPVNKFKPNTYKRSYNGFRAPIILVFYYKDGKLHINPDEEAWIRAIA